MSTSAYRLYELEWTFSASFYHELKWNCVSASDRVVLTLAPDLLSEPLKPAEVTVSRRVKCHTPEDAMAMACTQDKLFHMMNCDVRRVRVMTPVHDYEALPVELYTRPLFKYFEMQCVLPNISLDTLQLLELLTDDVPRHTWSLQTPLEGTTSLWSKASSVVTVHFPRPQLAALRESQHRFLERLRAHCPSEPRATRRVCFFEAIHEAPL